MQGKWMMFLVFECLFLNDLTMILGGIFMFASIHITLVFIQQKSVYV